MSASLKPVDYSLLSAHGIRELQPYQPGKPIEELERELGLTNIIKLASNENPLGPSPKAVAAVQRVLNQISRYPDGYELTSRLAAMHGVRPSQITLGNGSNQVLNIVAQTFLTPSCTAIVSEHAFIVYPLAVKMLGAGLKTVAAKEWGHDLAAMAAAIDDRTRMVFIANPNNPTGTWNTKQELHAFMRAVPPEVIVVLDEAYTEYVTTPEYESGMQLLDAYPNLVVTRTFSKAYGLAGLRVGYAVGSVEVSSLLNRVREPFNVNSLALVAAQAALEDTEYLEKSRMINQQGMRQLEAGFAALDLEYIPSLANFLAVRFKCNASDIYNKLLHKGVIVRPVGVYNMPQHLRISIGLPEENSRLLQALSEILH